MIKATLNECANARACTLRRLPAWRAHALFFIIIALVLYIEPGILAHYESLRAWGAVSSLCSKELASYPPQRFVWSAYVNLSCSSIVSN